MQAVRKTYNSYSIDTKLQVINSEDPNFYVDEGVPRTTALYWINNTEKIEEVAAFPNSFETQKITSLEKELQKHKALNKLLKIVRELHPYSFLEKKLKKKEHKKVIIKAIKVFEKYSSLKEALHEIKLSPSTYYRWISEFERCEFTGKVCQKRFSHQLTAEEINIMKTYVTSKKYSHVSISSLCLLAQREEKLFCCADTWYKYIKLNDWRRSKKVEYKKNYKDGLRAVHPNQYWQIDVSQISFDGPKKYYFQAIIDNYSRYIIAWHLTENISAENSIELIRQAKEKHQSLSSDFSINVMSDGGTENTANKVGQYILSSNFNQIIAGKDIKYSNSMIEHFFRSLKSNYLHFQKLRDKNDILRKINFYIDQHNIKIPKAILNGATPLEAYQKNWGQEEIQNLKEQRSNSLIIRRSLPVLPSCGVCP